MENNINSISLDSFNFLNMTLIKSREKTYKGQDHSRWVYKDQLNHLYYKLWNPTYIRKDNIIRGIESGFYDKETVPALKGLIYYEGECRGYVMDKVNESINVFKDFYKIIKEKTTSSNYFYFDYCEKHVMEYNLSPCLIDLEGIYPLTELQNFLDHKYNSSFADNDYKQFVCNTVK